MAYLRCESCGAKALPVATRCPACEAPFPRPQSRDPKPRVCSACDSYVSGRLDTCPWCQRSVAPVAPPAVLWTGGFVLLVVALAALFLSPLGEGLREQLGSTRSEEPGVEMEAPTEPPLADESRGGVRPDLLTGSAVQAMETEEAEAPAPPEPAPTRSRTAPPLPSDGSWTRALALTDVHVRNTPGVGGEIVGRVTVDDLVLLGGSEGSWRPIRAGADGELTGWVWGPFFRELEGGS